MGKGPKQTRSKAGGKGKKRTRTARRKGRDRWVPHSPPPSLRQGRTKTRENLACSEEETVEIVGKDSGGGHPILCGIGMESLGTEGVHASFPVEDGGIRHTLTGIWFPSSALHGTVSSSTQWDSKRRDGTLGSRDPGHRDTDRGPSPTVRYPSSNRSVPFPINVVGSKVVPSDGSERKGRVDGPIKTQEIKRCPLEGDGEPA